MVKWFLAASALMMYCSTLISQEINGFWKRLNEKTGNTQCVVAVYKYQGKYYGRIVSTYDKNGKLEATIDAPKTRAPGIVGKPFYCGMDLIWNLESIGSKYQGKIVDPQKGKVYNAKLWVEGGKLVVRGELLFFGRNELWHPVSQADFSAGFKQPDPATFIPNIPQVK
jgi:uncharacterized protein (DUF2147 family)